MPLLFLQHGRQAPKRFRRREESRRTKVWGLKNSESRRTVIMITRARDRHSIGESREQNERRRRRERTYPMSSGSRWAVYVLV